MSNFTPSNPIDDIGALELNHASVLLSDGALENAAVTVTAGPTIAPCTVMTCPRIDDDALEASADYAMAGPTIQYCNTLQGPPRCPRYIDDGAI